MDDVHTLPKCVRPPSATLSMLIIGSVVQRRATSEARCHIPVFNTLNLLPVSAPSISAIASRLCAYYKRQSLHLQAHAESRTTAPTSSRLALLTPTPISSLLFLSPRIRARLHARHRVLVQTEAWHDQNHEECESQAGGRDFVVLAMSATGPGTRMRIVKIVQIKMLLGGKAGA
ncbi:hypothetical protein FIBSPDRAFT_875293 [Athelia psychrophila]|uniref:Uncharacterized protein n=1 Tax=Athelia psychrophila TaxID=1759441 RepID=A0A165WGU1_9AGAM|nr:hypothetical protein FIBSPDRAFT_875293 [Fibularhizoctonia sp. CBS 109695]